MSQRPRVTVVIPAFNAERTIAETISCVLGQTYCEFELIVVNDGSVDTTEKIVEKFLNDRRICLINQQNAGSAAARNRGISAARSDLIAPLDADDLWHPTYLEKQLRSLNRHDMASFVYAWSRYIDSESRIIWTPHYPLVDGRVFRQILYWNFVANGSAMLFRKSAALKFNGYDARVASTEDFMLQIMLASRYECAVTPEYLVGYREHLGRKSEYPERMYSSCLRTLDLVQKECGGAISRVIHWKLGELHFNSAARAYFEGRLGDAIHLLALAHQSDPLGTSYRICSLVFQRGVNLIRRVTRGLFSAPPTSARTPFFEAGTQEVARRHRSVLRDYRLNYLHRLDNDSYRRQVDTLGSCKESQFF